jgi:hypothetical protein
LFNQFKGSKEGFITESNRCKIQPIAMFDSKKHWSVDRWWTNNEKIELGITEEENEVTKEEFIEFLKEKQKELSELMEKTVNVLQ